MKNKANQLISYITILIISLGLDFISKRWAVSNLINKPPMSIINGVLELLYTENRGAAFGMLQGKQFLFYIITFIVIATILYTIIKLPVEKHYLPLLIVLSFLSSGALGNMVDRVFKGYVVDFIYFKPINFPVFNVADIYVTCSAVALIILLIFVYKDDDFAFITKSKR